MGCVCSRTEREDNMEELSFADYAVGSQTVGKGHDSGELGFVVDAKPNKVSESSLLGRAGIYGLDKAVEVLDTLGSSMSNLNPNSGFLSGIAARGNKISILAFEVANTIAKGSNLMQSLSEENIQFLKNEILPSEGIQQLVSTDNRELLTIAANDKREEFRVFSTEVARFGDLCKDPEWHNLSRYFEKLDSDPTPREQLKEEAEATMQQLLTLAQCTSELYHEFNALDRLEHDFKRKIQDEELVPQLQRGDSLMIFHNELKQQRKLVKNLKKKSLWLRNMEEVVEKLVEVVVFLYKEILNAFDLSGSYPIEGMPTHSRRSLGVSGLALHYANVINQINNIVSRPMVLPPNTRDTLYRLLPLGVKAALRSRFLSFHADELTVPLIKAELQKILRWILPMVEHTIKAHQGFGWVGEWANMGVESNRKPTNSVFRIQTLHHADKEKTEEYILQLVVWLHHLVDQVKNKGYGFNPSKPIHLVHGKSASPYPDDRNGSGGSTKKAAILQLSWEDRQMLESVSQKRLVLVRSKSHGFTNSKANHGGRMSRSTGSSPTRKSSNALPSQFRGRSVLDVIDGVDILEPFGGVFRK